MASLRTVEEVVMESDSQFPLVLGQHRRLIAVADQARLVVIMESAPRHGDQVGAALMSTSPSWHLEKSQ